MRSLSRVTWRRLVSTTRSPTRSTPLPLGSSRGSLLAEPRPTRRRMVAIRASSSLGLKGFGR